MAQAAKTSSQEYWRPANPDVLRLVSPALTGAACRRCGTECAPGALFCHICGSERQPRAAARTTEPVNWVELGNLRRRLGLSVACLAFFLLGVTCMIGAALTGIVYKSQTLADWQAVQMWRVEWLLGAAAALLAGILLKRKSA